MKKEIIIINKRKRIYIYHNKLHILTIKNDSDVPITLESLLMTPDVNIFHALNFKLNPGEAPPFRGQRGAQLGKASDEQKTIYKKIGSILKKNREDAGMSMSHVVGKLSLNLPVLQKTEAGARRIYQSEIRLLCQLYDAESAIPLKLLEELEDLEYK